MIETKNELIEKLSEIKSHVTVISGMKDKVCSQTSQIELLKEKITDIKVFEIENGGHALPFTHQDEIAKIIISEKNDL